MGEVEAALAGSTDELDLLADRCSLFIPMAERGGCYMMCKFK